MCHAPVDLYLQPGFAETSKKAPKKLEFNSYRYLNKRLPLKTSTLFWGLVFLERVSRLLYLYYMTQLIESLIERAQVLS